MHPKFNWERCKSPGERSMEITPIRVTLDPSEDHTEEESFFSRRM